LHGHDIPNTGSRPQLRLRNGTEEHGARLAQVAGAYILNTFCHGWSRSLSEQFLPQWLSPISPRVSYLQQVVPLVVDALKFSDRVLAGLEFEALSSVAKNASNPDVSLISNLVYLISLCTYPSFQGYVVLIQSFVILVSMNPCASRRHTRSCMIY